MPGFAAKYTLNLSPAKFKMQYPQINLKPGKEQSLQRFHPWIFSGAIKRLPENLNDGDIVEVNDSFGNYIATGHYQTGSIAVRIFSFEKADIDENFWLNKLAMALEVRKKLGLYQNQETNIFRLVHGEGDSLPGLIVDIYGSTAVIQAHSAGMFRIRKTVAQQIIKLLNGTVLSVYDKSSGTVSGKINEEIKDEYIAGPPINEVVVEHGNKFTVSWEEGQKTGFFVDQRENRLLLEKFSKGASVLNTFGYTGGFSVYALRGGAAKVVTVDSSQKAIDLTNRNVELNFGKTDKHESVCTDVFTFLKDNQEKFDVIILDPPAFAKNTHALRNALQAYKRLNAAAFRLLNPGGILFTFSCSQVVSRENFRNAVFSGSIIANRQVRILHQLTQPADHPINIYHPEGEYLKGLVLEIN